MSPPESPPDKPPAHGASHHHGHGPGHAHEAGGAPVVVEGDPESLRAPLARGAGEGKLLFFDAFSGVAGDMTIAALIDLGVPFAEVEGAVRCLGIEGAGLSLHRAFAGAIGATRFDVTVEPGQPERSYRAIDDLLQRAPLANEVSVLARAIFRRLAEAEAEVHRIDVSAVHFHEVGAVDAIVDIVGAAACLSYLGATVMSSALPMGRGFVQCRHGVLPLPAPATLACLSGMPTYDAGIEAELVTPTGAAIVGTVARDFRRWPDLCVERIGWGAGTQSLPDRPNALRVVLGSQSETAASSDGTHVILEANIDDMTGELLGHAIQALLDAGALDAWATPITMKKGRPGWALGALAQVLDADRVVERMLKETTTIGVRKTLVQRTVRPRRRVDVETPYGRIPVKVSEGPFGPARVKPEFDECVVLARGANVPVWEVVRCAEQAAAELQSGRSSSKPALSHPSTPPSKKDTGMP